MSFGRLGGMGRGFGRLGAPLGGVTYSPEAQAIFASFTTPPTTARKQIINTCVVALKTAGVWSLLDVLYVLAAADSQAARINWKNPATFTASPSNSPTFTADRGYAGDGSTSFLNSGFNPATAGGQFALNDGHHAIYSRTDGTSAGNEFGNSNNRMFIRSGTNFFSGRMMSSAGPTGAPSSTNAVGHFCMSRTGSSSFSFYINGGAANVSNDASSALTSATFHVCAANAVAFSTRQIAASHFGAGLSQAQNNAAYNAILTYLQAIGAA